MLRIHPDRRHLADEHGKTVYLIGDTAWELFHSLSREEAIRYLDCRAEQRFNFIQCVILSERGGLTEPNAYGRLPLLTGEGGIPDPTLPDLAGDYNYFDHVEFIVTEAERRGLMMGILPTWGDKFNNLWGGGPEIFTPENAFLYGKWLAGCLKHHDNLVWILGGDRPLTEEKHYAVVDAMAAGLRAGDGGKFLMTYHPMGAQSSSAFVHAKDWLDFDMFQSGHGWPTPPSYEMAAHDRSLSPVKPTMDGEQRYEDHPINFQPEKGYFDAYDVRVTMWRNLFSGTCGNTYGHHAVWCMSRQENRYFPNVWETALHRPAAESVRIFAAFVDAHDCADLEPIRDAILENESGANYVAAVLVRGEHSAYLLSPCGIPEKLNPERFPAPILEIRAFCPADGGEIPVIIRGDGSYFFPDRPCGRGQDAVIALAW
ncbi:MAG: DUF4038 domain-containing protein [Clostridiales bacterium]|nr:DUF4038 domain-containing protein [Clostridiales bacterium]